MKLDKKVAWVTGAGNGIGRATASRLANAGASLIVSDIDEGAAEETSKQINAAGGDSKSIQGSVADEHDVQRMVQFAIDSFGSLHILINNAGINRDAVAVRIKDGEVKKMGSDKWDPVLEVNLKGSFLCAQAAAVPMIEQQYGKIVNTSSIGALGNIGQANYAASKAGVIGLTKTLALELARYNINVNCVAPGATKTQMTAGIPEKFLKGLIGQIPLRRLAEPEEIAEAHLFLVSDASTYITGQILFVDGGISVGV